MARDIITTTITGIRIIIEKGGGAMNEKTPGIFYGVGVGPGDPELITRKAERILAAVDWIFLPSETPDGSSFVRRIVEPLGLPEHKFWPVSMSMSRDRTADGNAYRWAAGEIVKELRQGKSAAWITQGDPLFYSTFVHLLEEVRRYPAIAIEIVPGVTSASAAAARAGLAIARLDERVAVIPAAYGLDQLPRLLDEFATVFLLKVHGAIDELLTVLKDVKGSVEAVYVEQVGTPAERVVTDLESLLEQKLPYFSLVILQRRAADVSPPVRSEI
jgi:precorrin-2/cobalt-factor-2 C20-methyltransferase